MSIVRRVVICILLAVVGRAAGATGWADTHHKTANRVGYKCLFNHELLIITHQKQNSASYIQSYVEKLKDTDVDAVMCCPTAWRTNLFPSQVDPGWKKYRPEQPLSEFRSYDYIMRYLHAGGDPVRDTLAACRKCNKDFFISYRMNDAHYVNNRSWPTHNAFWREHPQYWLGDSDTSPYTKQDNVRLFNYLLPPVRDYYFAILQELCVNYDVDGVELDFQRYPKFFPSDRLGEGRRVMTEFVKRIKEMTDRIGRERGKSLKLCVRVPHTLAACSEAGLDVPGWDAAGLVEMINVSSFYVHSMELGIEEFRTHTRHAKIYGEMNYVTAQSAKNQAARRYTTVAVYRATALNLFCRGADGLSLFNYDYVNDYVPEKLRLPMTEGLKRITDVEFLKTTSKDYVVTPRFGSLPAKNDKTLRVIIPDDTRKVAFQRAVLRVETKANCVDQPIDVWVNGKPLVACTPAALELFPPLAQNEAYPAREMLKFYSVPLDVLVAGANEVKITHREPKKSPCTFVSLEIALYR